MAVSYHNLYGAGGSAQASTSPYAAAAAAAIVESTFNGSMNQCHLYSLPNELVLHILSLLTTTELLPLAPVSHRIYALTIRLLHLRLVQATQFPGGALILECYPPSQKLTAPALDCLYTGTPNIESCVNESCVIGSRDSLKNLYCCFRPQRREWRRFNRTIPGDIPGSRTHPTSATAAQAKWQAEREEEKVKQVVSLDGHELFLQLEGNLHLVKQMGFIQNLVAVHEGYVRIWRDWLGQRANADAICDLRKRTVELEEAKPSTSTSSDTQVETMPQQGRLLENEDILWLDSTKNVGLRVIVKEKKWRRNAPVLMYADEEVSVSYEIVYEGISHVLGIHNIGLTMFNRALRTNSTSCSDT
jgi:hypothetical protein